MVIINLTSNKETSDQGDTEGSCVFNAHSLSQVGTCERLALSKARARHVRCEEATERGADSLQMSVLPLALAHGFESR